MDSNLLSMTNNQFFAPGKLILIGEHAVVSNFSAIVLPLSKGITCTITSNNSNNIVINNTLTDITHEYSWNILNENNDIIPIEMLVLKILCEKFVEIKKQSINIIFTRDIPIGGFGASTAFITSYLKAIFNFYKINISTNQLIDLVIEIEATIQGFNPSGVDQNVIVRNKPILFNKTQPINEISLPQLFDRILIIYSGKPKFSTGEVVNMVQNNSTSNSIFIEIDKLTNQLLRLIENNTLTAEKLTLIIDQAQKYLQELDIVSQSSQDLINTINAMGGHCKISGAGTIGKFGGDSGAIICFADKYEPIIDFLQKNKIEYIWR
jgi:mevalonate kinase